MEQGYILVHVLEVIVPDADLGPTPSCKLTVSGSSVEEHIAGPVWFSVPSTLQSEKAALPLAGEEEPVLIVRAFDSRSGAIGSVVVPINTLVPLEVWNVWYAMDGDGSNGDQEDIVNPEDMSKMHLLLQHVPPQTAAEESAQLREMREQDFLLRALQQLNASLEAKVMSQQGSMRVSVDYDNGASAESGPGPDPCCKPPPTPSTALPTGVRGLASDGMGASVSTTAALTTRKEVCPAPESSSPSTQPSSPQQQQQRQRPGSEMIPLETDPDSPLREMICSRPSPAQSDQKQPWEDRQQLYDDQAARVEELSKSLRDRENRIDVLNQQLESLTNKWSSRIDHAHETSQRAVSRCDVLEQEKLQLEQEIEMQKIKDSSKETQLRLKEEELESLRKRCASVVRTDEELASLKQELLEVKEAKRDALERLDEQRQKALDFESQLLQTKEEHSKVLLEERKALADLRKQDEDEKRELRSCQDTLRSKVATCSLLKEKVSELVNQLKVSETEASSYKALLESEKTRRTGLEKKFQEEELQRLHSIIGEYDDVVRELRQEVMTFSSQLDQERIRSAGLEGDLARVRQDLASRQQSDDGSRMISVEQDALKRELKVLQDQNQSLRRQLEMAEDSVATVSERQEEQLNQRAQAIQDLNESLEIKQQALAVSCLEVDSLRRQLARAKDSDNNGNSNNINSNNTNSNNSSNSSSHSNKIGSKASDTALLREHQEAIEAEIALRKEVERQLQVTKEECHLHAEARSKLHEVVRKLTARKSASLGEGEGEVFPQDIPDDSNDLEKALEERDAEIKMLMYRVQELSSKYTPVRSDPVDVAMGKWINGIRPAVPFFRLSQGNYLFGRRQVTCKVVNDKPLVRAAGATTFWHFEKFLEHFASEELEKLLNYEIDETTGKPKFLEAQHIKQVMEESGVMESLRPVVSTNSGSQASSRPSDRLVPVRSTSQGRTASRRLMN